jgi:hypothetical protein
MTDWLLKFQQDLDAVLTSPVTDNGAGEEKTPAPASSLSDAVDSEVAGGGLVEMTDESF